MTGRNCELGATKRGCLKCLQMASLHSQLIGQKVVVQRVVAMELVQMVDRLVERAVGTITEAGSEVPVGRLAERVASLAFG